MAKRFLADGIEVEYPDGLRLTSSGAEAGGLGASPRRPRLSTRAR